MFSIPVLSSHLLQVFRGQRCHLCSNILQSIKLIQRQHQKEVKDLDTKRCGEEVKHGEAYREQKKDTLVKGVHIFFFVCLSVAWREEEGCICLSLSFSNFIMQSLETESKSQYQQYFLMYISFFEIVKTHIATYLPLLSDL